MLVETMTEYRINHIIQQLVLTDKQISNISFEVALGMYSIFTKCLRQKRDKPPQLSQNVCAQFSRGTKKHWHKTTRDGYFIG